MESIDIWKSRFLSTINTDDVEGYLVREILNFKTAGGTQSEAEQIISSIWQECEDRGMCDPKLTQALESMIDAITGNCSPSCHLFRSNFLEEHFFRAIPSSGG